MIGFLKQKSVDEKEIIEIKKKIAYIETDMVILKSQYQRLLDRYKIEAMTDARQKKKDTEKRRKEWDKTRREISNKKWMLWV